MIYKKQIAIGLVSMGAFITSATCQANCEGIWTATSREAGVDSRVVASTLWDPDGLGPQPPKLIVGGYFNVAGGVAANAIAMWGPATHVWQALTPSAIFLDNSGSFQTPGGVLSLACDQGGTLIVGGRFTDIGSVAANYVASWNGTSWQAMGGGFNGGVLALLVLPSGDIMAGGLFTEADGQPATGIARWNGTAWLPVGAGFDSGVYSLIALPNGDIVAGGAFLASGGTATGRIARWDGVAWQPIGSGMNSAVDALALASNGDILAGGLFTLIGGQAVRRVARWDGSSWNGLGAGLPVGVGLPGRVLDLHVEPNGDVIAGGRFLPSGGTTTASVARWDGLQWHEEAGAFRGSADSLTALPDGTLVAAGALRGAPGLSNVAKWDGVQWSALNFGMDNTVYDVAELADGRILFAGEFLSTNDGPASCLAIYDGVDWQEFGRAETSPVAQSFAARAILELANGDVIVGGDFSKVSGVNAGNIARWCNGTWHAMPWIGGSVSALAVAANGDLFAGGSFGLASGTAANGIARWDGQAWHVLSIGPFHTGVSGEVKSLAFLPSGDLIVGGSFYVNGASHIRDLARWDGLTWHAMGIASTAGINCCQVFANGDLMIAGDSIWISGHSTSHVARWDGTSWHTYGSPPYNEIHDLEELPNGDIIAAGRSRIWRWNGSTWSLMSEPNGYVHTVELLHDGSLLFGGAFSLVDGIASAYSTRLVPACPGSVSAYGSGCGVSAGAGALSSDDLPWVGSVFTSNATSLPQSVILCEIVGFGSQSLSLPTILPAALAGCELLVTPDVIDFSVQTGGAAEVHLALPNVPAFAGTMIHQQLLSIDLHAGSQAGQVSVTNALSLVLGSL